jgi:hypothetical protein
VFVTRLLRLRAFLTVAVVCSAVFVDAKPPKVVNLAACPAWGSEARGSSRAALNEVKHRIPSAASPTMLAFGDMTTLQQQADARVKSGASAKVSAKSREKLRDLEIPSGRVGEGNLVAIVGFVVGKPSVNPGESANCYLTGATNNDFEFNIAPAADATPYDGIVGEMIPQDRPKTWTLDRLRKLAADHRQVLVVGQLMFDTRHLPNPKRGTNHESPRMSTWEIHPVTKLLVCRQAGSGCDPRRDEQWQPLESMAER